MKSAEFKDLLGKTLTSVVGQKGDSSIDFTCDNGDVYQLYHSQGCCETVRVDDICGEWSDLIGSPITQAEENSSNDNPPGVEVPTYQDSFLWTFYRLSTAKGQVVIRWYGESNGYYSESVDFQLISNPNPTQPMNNNQSPQDFVAGLPIAAPVSVAGEVLAPLPAASLLSAAERLRLDKLAVSGEVPVAPFPIQSQEITTFSCGSVLKWMPRPGSETQCILVEATGIQIAIVKDVNFAEFLCNAANIFVIATAKNNNTDNPLQILTKPIIVPNDAN